MSRRRPSPGAARHPLPASRGEGSAEPLCRLVHFAATDGVALAGLLYEPKRRTRRALIWLHGTGGASIFDATRTNALARELVARGIAFFPFNNRGAHLVRRLRRGEKRIDGGTAHEVLRDCVHDIDGAVRELRRRGYRELFLAGHSTGANKIAIYDHRKRRNPVRRYVLLGGGDDTGMLYAQLGPRRFLRALEKARARMREKRGHEIVPRGISPMMLSWRSFYDTANPNGDYNVFPFLEVMRGIRLGTRRRFRYVGAIRKPSLYIYGDRDEFSYGDVPRCVAILAGNVGPNAEIVVMEDADHGFTGREEELGRLIAEWLTS
jgi:pimeloyl-ACP methyl ester carboxylesterase